MKLEIEKYIQERRNYQLKKLVRVKTRVRTYGSHEYTKYAR